MVGISRLTFQVFSVNFHRCYEIERCSLRGDLKQVAFPLSSWTDIYPNFYGQDDNCPPDKERFFSSKIAGLYNCYEVIIDADQSVYQLTAVKVICLFQRWGIRELFKMCQSTISVWLGGFLWQVIQEVEFFGTVVVEAEQTGNACCWVIALSGAPWNNSGPRRCCWLQWPA